MAISDIISETRTIGKAKASFEVRGLSLVDISGLVNTNAKELSAMVGGESFESIIKRYPEFVGKLIAIAADETDNHKQAATLPIGIQISALKAIWELSQIDSDELGNVAVQVLQSLQRLNKSLQSGKKPSANKQSSSSAPGTATKTLSKDTP